MLYKFSSVAYERENVSIFHVRFVAFCVYVKLLKSQIKRLQVMGR